MYRHAQLTVGVLTLIAPAAHAQPFAVARYTVDGGGGVSAGGAYEVLGTIGQHEAGPSQIGGAYELTGGFWISAASGGCNAADLTPPYGILDFSDVVTFLTAFGAMDPAADLADPSGVFDFSDVVTFLSAFGAGCP